MVRIPRMLDDQLRFNYSIYPFYIVHKPLLIHGLSSYFFPFLYLTHTPPPRKRQNLSYPSSSGSPVTVDFLLDFLHSSLIAPIDPFSSVHSHSRGSSLTDHSLHLRFPRSRRLPTLVVCLISSVSVSPLHAIATEHGMWMSRDSWRVSVIRTPCGTVTTKVTGSLEPLTTHFVSIVHQTNFILDILKINK